MNKKYQTPKMDVLMFEIEDIVTASDPVEEGWDSQNGEENKQYPNVWKSYDIN